MSRVRKDRPLYQRIAIDIAGFGLMFISPFLGWLPGPGGIPLFVAGLGLVSLNHEWAERLLKNFEKKLKAFTDKYLTAGQPVSYIIDAALIILILCGLYLGLTQSQLAYKGMGFALASISIIILFSNQKRFSRLIKRIKKR